MTPPHAHGYTLSLMWTEDAPLQTKLRVRYGAWVRVGGAEHLALD